MQLLSKTVHVLALGLWFGMAVFFSFPVALSLFHTFEEEAKKPAAERSVWFPQPPEYALEPQLAKEQGTRAAGTAISPLFDYYFLLQGICAFLATVTALGWTRAEPGTRVHTIRALALVLALTTVVLGWPVERKVAELRHDQNVASDALMARLKQDRAASGSADAQAVAAVRATAEAAHKDFVTWHLWSLLLNMLTVLLVTVAMALAARLPVAGSASSVAMPRALA